uniref:Mon2 C-terminal domain-containing protein n=1 Tax=Acrobeloides nanus TaxID=290746 RepID=A0A914C8G9_9BILA
MAFSLFAIHQPVSEFVVPPSKDPAPAWIQQNLIAFAELSLKTVVEYYGKVANFPEIIRETVLVDILKCISEPLSLKYQCLSQTTWKLSASAFISICKVGLPVARENLHMFTLLWPQLATTLERFLFTTSRSPTPLNSDERKRHEFVDCQMIELIRLEILPHTNRLPAEFMQRIIDILNRGSISTLDPHDVFEAYAQRTDLSKVCFDALLSMSQSETPDIVQTVHGRAGGVVGTPHGSPVHEGSSSTLGSSAIASLLYRCKQVMNGYAKDQQSSGHLKLPQERIFEVISVLRAISSLIEGLTKHPEAVHSALYSHLVNLHPVLVQMIPSCRSDQQVELSVMTALNSYQTLLLLNIHKK